MNGMGQRLLRMRQTAKARYPATAAPTHTARLSPGPPSPPARPPAEAVVAAAIWGSVIWRSFVTCDAADARVALRHPPSRVRTRERTWGCAPAGAARLRENGKRQSAAN